MAERVDRYAAFVSYSHEADARFAPTLQRTIERLGKPWYRRRAIELFRDQSDLAVHPNLWPRIAAALDSSKCLLLLGSPAAAASPWVSKEIAHWRSNHDITDLVIALTDGEIAWDAESGDFDWQRTTAIPKVLAGAFADEPLWADFRSVTTAKNQASLREPAVRLAAGVRGMAPRDLDAEDLHQHRRTLRVAGTAVISLLLLTVGLAVATLQALQQRQLAVSRELAALSAAQLTVDPDLGVTLALRAGEVATTAQAERALRAALPQSLLKRTLSSGPGSFPNHPVFNRDGTRLVTSNGWSFLGKGQDFTARIWDLTSGRLVATVPDQPTQIRSSTFSPDGRLVLTVAAEPIARLWNADSGEARATLDCGADIVTAAFSPDGRSVVTAGADGRALLWDVTVVPPKVRLTLKHEDAVNDASFSPDGNQLLTTYGEHHLLDLLADAVFSLFTKTERAFHGTVWDLRSGRETVRLTSTAAPIERAWFSADGRRIISASSSGVSTWNASDGKLTASIPAPPEGITALASTPDGRWMVIGTRDGTVQVWDGVSGKQRADLHGHRLMVTSVAISSDGATAFSAGGDPEAIAWDVATARPVAYLRGHKKRTTGLALSPDGRTIATSSSDGVVRLWKVPTLAAIDGLSSVGDVDRVAISPDGKRIMVEGSSRITVWARRTGALLGSFNRGRLSGGDALSGDGMRVFLLESRPAPAVYDATTGKKVAELAGITSFATTTFNRDGTRLAVADHDALTFRDVGTGRASAPTPLTFTVRRLEFTPRDDRLLIIGDDATELRDVATGALVATLTGSHMNYSPSGARFVAVDARSEKDSRKNRPRIYDASSGKVVAEFPDEPNPAESIVFLAEDRVLEDRADTARVSSVTPLQMLYEFPMPGGTFRGGLATSPDGRFLALAGTESVAIWEPERHRLVQEFGDYSADVTSAAFTPDGQTFVTGSADGTVHVYPIEAFLPFDEVIQRARAIQWRMLSDSELRTLASR
jgi:WD40 repeat protein